MRLILPQAEYVKLKNSKIARLIRSRAKSRKMNKREEIDMQKEKQVALCTLIEKTGKTLTQAMKKLRQTYPKLMDDQSFSDCSMIDESELPEPVM